MLHQVDKAHRVSGDVDVQFHDGDLLIMDGRVQQYFRHNAPKEAVKGKRINVTWRWSGTNTRTNASWRLRAGLPCPLPSRR